MTILNNPHYFKQSRLVDFAEKLLECFVLQFGVLYGNEFVTHNVHNLYHLVADCRTYGLLENFSAFKFENFIARIKNMLRKGDQTLQQLQRRFEEMEILGIMKSAIAVTQIEVTHPRHLPIDRADFKIKNQYAFLKCLLFTLNVDDDRNNCVLIDNTAIVEVKNIVSDYDDVLFIIGKPLKIIGDLYIEPMRSSRLGIHVVQHQHSDLHKYCIDRISAKLFKLPYELHFVTFPILHTYKQI